MDNPNQYRLYYLTIRRIGKSKFVLFNAPVKRTPDFIIKKNNKQASYPPALWVV